MRILIPVYIQYYINIARRVYYIRDARPAMSAPGTTADDNGDPTRRVSVPPLWEDISQLLETMNDRGAKLQGDVRARLEALRREGQSAWRKRITGDGDKRIRDHAREGVERLRGRATKGMRKALTGNPDVKISDHLKTTPVVKLIDRLSFTLGIIHFALTEFIVLKMPQVFWAWFAVTITLLLGYRIHSYTQKRWGFFMFDFCYFCTLTALVNVTLLPASTVAWQVNFVFANGPLMVAVLAWRNSLVFHSLDKMTSIFIHILPAILTFLVRWYPEVRGTMCARQTAPGAWQVRTGGGDGHGEESTTWTENFRSHWDWADPCPRLTFEQAVLLPAGVYLFWQVAQILITEVLLGSMLAQDLTLQTSVRWLCKDYRNGMHQLCKRVCRKLGIFAQDETFDPEAWKSKFIFWTAQFVYTLLTIVPGVIVYHSYTLHVCFLCYVMTGCIWNGASFYIEVFSRRYNLKFADVADGNIGHGGGSGSGYQDPDALPEPGEPARAKKAD